MKALLLMLLSFLLISCDPTEVKSDYYCSCHLYGSGTTGERVRYQQVDKKNREVECDEIEKEVKKQYDNPSFNVTAQCQVVEDY